MDYLAFVSKILSTVCGKKRKHGENQNKAPNTMTATGNDSALPITIIQKQLTNKRSICYTMF